MCRPYVHVANESTLRSCPHEYFRSRMLFLYESALRPHEASESAHRNRIFLKPLSGYAETVSLLVICVNAVSGFNRLFGYVYDTKIL